jgi:hypothetical protein
MQHLLPMRLLKKRAQTRLQSSSALSLFADSMRIQACMTWREAAKKTFVPYDWIYLRLRARDHTKRKIKMAAAREERCQICREFGFLISVMEESLDMVRIQIDVGPSRHPSQ